MKAMLILLSKMGLAILIILAGFIIITLITVFIMEIIKLIQEYLKEKK